MARLSEQQKLFITQRLACFDTPTTVVESVKEEFGIVMTRQWVQQYDPTKAAGKTLSKKLKAAFEATREEFLKGASGIAVSHKSVRLRRLERMADKAEGMRNYALAAQLLEQVAKECGDAFTNLRKVAPTDPDGETPYREYSERELNGRIRELLDKVGGED